MKAMDQVTVIGVGLIGASLALAWREHGLCVVGYDQNEQSVRQAVARGAIDRGETELERAVADADVIVLSTPVHTIRAYLAQLAALPLKPGAIVTDTGSTKAELVRFATQLKWGDAVYIGGHPMAGSHRSGVKAARAHLFENAYYVLTPTADTPREAVQRLSDLCALTRAKVMLLDAVTHDRVMAAISHFPHVLAALLVRQVGEYNEANDVYHRLAAGGFRDLTRIASSDPVMWRDITLSNREMLLELLDDWERGIAQFRHLLTLRENDQQREIEAFFRSAKRYRDELPQRKHGSLPRVYECYVDVEDTPGIIGQVATLLGEADISLANIGIVENRENISGVLRLSFQQSADFTQAVAVLKSHGYTVYEPDAEVVEKGREL